MTRFDQAVTATQIQELSSQQTLHKVMVSDDYSVNKVPNGGYLMALLAHQMLERSDKNTTPIITVNFLAKSLIAPAEVYITEISNSRQFNRYEARLVQDEKEVLHGIGSFVADDLECIINRYEEKAANIAPREECVAFPQMPDFTIYDNMDVRLEPESAPWLNGEKGTKSEHRGWIRFRDDRPFDICGILLAADTFPPAIFATEGPTGWVPTIEMSINIRNLPRSRWLKCRFRTRHVTCGLLEEDGELWDEAGNLVAISRQIAQFRS